MKLQPESKKEMKRMTCGVAFCTAVMFVVFAALHVVDLAPFGVKVIYSGLCGGAVALANFYGICRMTEKAVAEQDEKRRRAKIQLSYNRRMLLQAAWIAVALLCPWFQWAAAIAPLAFPRLTIYYLQITGQFRKETPKKGIDISVEETADAPAGDPAKQTVDEGGESEVWK